MVAFQFIDEGKNLGITEDIEWGDFKNQALKCTYLGNTYICAVLLGQGTAEVVLYGRNNEVFVRCRICGVISIGYDQSFVENYHPNYNCDEIAWLDDACCALDNETSNHAHWDYLANCIVEEPWEEDACNAIYDYEVDGISTEEEILSKMEMKFNSTEEFGAYLADKYKDDIQADIDYYEGKIMEEAINNFEYKFNIEEL